MAVKRRHKVPFLAIGGIRKERQRVIEALLEEINALLGLKDDRVVTVMSYRPGRERLYQVVVKDLKNGVETPLSPWFTNARELEDALHLTRNVLRLMHR